MEPRGRETVGAVWATPVTASYWDPYNFATSISCHRFQAVQFREGFGRFPRFNYYRNQVELNQQRQERISDVAQAGVL